MENDTFIGRSLSSVALKKCSTYLFSFLNPLNETSVFENKLYSLTSFLTADGSFHIAKIELGYQPIDGLLIAFEQGGTTRTLATIPLWKFSVVKLTLVKG